MRTQAWIALINKQEAGPVWPNKMKQQKMGSRRRSAGIAQYMLATDIGLSLYILGITLAVGRRYHCVKVISIYIIIIYRSISCECVCDAEGTVRLRTYWK